MIRLQGLTEKIHPEGTCQILCAASNFVDYFEATPYSLAVSRCPLTLRRKKLYTQRRRGQCHIRKSSWQHPISIPLPTCRDANTKTKQGGIATGRFPLLLMKKPRRIASRRCVEWILLSFFVLYQTKYKNIRNGIK